MVRGTDLGAVQIRNDVIGSIAALAAQEVDGVVGVWKPFVLPGFLGGGSGVRVQAQEQEAKIWIPLVVEYGVNLPHVASQVQDKVREAVEQMTQLAAVEVNVSIQQIKAKRSGTP